MTQLEILRIIAYVGGLIAVGVIVATPIVVWAKRIAHAYHKAHTTVMAAYERQTRARRRAGMQQEKPQ